jgi:hypothetical protein
MLRRLRLSEKAVMLAAACAVSACAASAQPQNLAKDRPYTMTPAPSYPRTDDTYDDRQLTDGIYARSNPIWVNRLTVGWTNASPVTIVIDLGSLQPIGGVSYNTAAGTAGVQWPRSIFVLVSDDGRRFFPVADLTNGAAGTGPPAESGYRTFRFRATGLSTHGRFVALIVDQNGPYTFCDEIEVLAGDSQATRGPLTGESTADLQEYFVKARTRLSVQRRLGNDLEAARAALSSAAVSAAVRERLSNELNRLRPEVDAMRASDPATFSTVLPLNEVHARIFAVHGTIAHETGLPALTAWAANPWDFIRPLERPRLATPTGVSIAAMNGETRAGAVNVANSTGQPATVRLTVTGLPPDAAGDLQLAEVVWTDTRELIPVADALVPLAAPDAPLTLPAGMTRQIWIRFTPRQRRPGRYAGQIELRSGRAAPVRAPLELNVLPGTFPARPTLHVGGWDYTNTITYGLTPGNVPQLIAQLRALGVDSPWATTVVMPAGRFDAAGRLIEPPGTAQFDAWIDRWPGAAQYCVFVAAPDPFGNVRAAEGARFSEAVGQWITFWVRHAARRGIAASQLVLLLVDEPHSPAQDDQVVTWAHAIKAAQPDVRIWEDPTYPDPAAAKPRLIDVSDVLALNRSLMIKEGPPFIDFYRERRKQGKELAIYGASGPARLLDPYSYYRLQAWWCADLGATSSFFWSFSDDAEGHSWSEYGTTKTPYSPLFLSAKEVTGSKHAEAIREGIEDFEYLEMLRQRVGALNASDPSHPRLKAAAALLASATAAVLGSAGAADEHWLTDKDRTVADRVRLTLAEALVSLAERR